jgi:ubiquinol-cytochrome c reductase cytochrome b subunit
MAKGLVNWLDARIGYSELMRSQFTDCRVPSSAGFFQTLGIAAIVGLIAQVLSGMLLLVYYVPHAEHAFRSVQDIMTVVPFGWLVRLVHIVGSNLLVAVVLVHLLSVFVAGSYRKPRELTWVTGAVLLLLVLSLCFTGYLLPWSQHSYWATTIMITMPTHFPVVGEYLAKLLKGGEAMSGATLNRFFGFHVGLLPLLCVLVAAMHVFLVKRIGIFGGWGGADIPESGSLPENGGEGMPVCPDFAAKAAVTVMCYLAVMFFIMSFAPTLFLPEDAAVPANPLKTSVSVRPQWYFLAPYQMLKLIPHKFFGIILEGLLIVAFVLWPFLDTRGGGNLLSRPLLRLLFPLMVAVWLVLTIWGNL